jgi:hypothetical protein
VLHSIGMACTLARGQRVTAAGLPAFPSRLAVTWHWQCLPTGLRFTIGTRMKSMVTPFCPNGPPLTSCIVMYGGAEWPTPPNRSVSCCWNHRPRPLSGGHGSTEAGRAAAASPLTKAHLSGPPGLAYSRAARAAHTSPLLVRLVSTNHGHSLSDCGIPTPAITVGQMPWQVPGP